MASLVITNIFANSTTADATQVNTNFQNIVDATSNGSIDFNIGALATSGSCIFGDASSDSITFNGSLASTIPIKTTNTYNIGSSTLGLASIYLGANSQTVRLLASASMSATYSLTLPVNAGTKGYVPETDGAGVTAWVPNLIKTFTQTADTDYTVLDTDGYRVVNMNMTGGTGKTVTLPLAANNTHRILTVRRLGAGAGTVTVDGAGVETINGNATIIIYGIYDSLTIQCNGVSWDVIETNFDRWVAWTPTGTFNNTTYTGAYKRRGDSAEFQVWMQMTGTVGAATMTITLPNSWTIDTSKLQNSTSTNYTLGQALMQRGQKYAGTVRYVTTTTIGVATIQENANAKIYVNVTQNNPDQFVNGDEITLRFSLPLGALAI